MKLLCIKSTRIGIIDFAEKQIIDIGEPIQDGIDISSNYVGKGFITLPDDYQEPVCDPKFVVFDKDITENGTEFIVGLREMTPKEKADLQALETQQAEEQRQYQAISELNERRRYAEGINDTFLQENSTFKNMSKALRKKQSENYKTFKEPADIGDLNWLYDAYEETKTDEVFTEARKERYLLNIKNKIES